jgi:hypothetical protein
MPDAAQDDKQHPTAAMISLHASAEPGQTLVEI